MLNLTPVKNYNVACNSQGSVQVSCRYNIRLVFFTRFLRIVDFSYTCIVFFFFIINFDRSGLQLNSNRHRAFGHSNTWKIMTSPTRHLCKIP